MANMQQPIKQFYTEWYYQLNQLKWVQNEPSQYEYWVIRAPSSAPAWLDKTIVNLGAKWVSLSTTNPICRNNKLQQLIGSDTHLSAIYATKKLPF
jgi:hypothetical protein